MRHLMQPFVCMAMYHCTRLLVCSGRRRQTFVSGIRKCVEAFFTNGLCTRCKRLKQITIKEKICDKATKQKSKLRAYVVPSIFPNAPSYLTTSNQIRLTSKQPTLQVCCVSFSFSFSVSCDCEATTNDYIAGGCSFYNFSK